MISSEQLHALIHSLNASEKAYFKKFASLDGNKDKGYIRLFDALNEMKAFDEKMLGQKLKKLRLDKHYTKLKPYLFDRVTDSLLELELHKDKSLIAYSNYLKSRLLAKKEQYKAAIEYSDTALEQARLASDYSLLCALHNSTFDLHRSSSAILQKNDYEETVYAPFIDAVKNVEYACISSVILYKMNFHLTHNTTVQSQKLIDEIIADVMPWFNQLKSATATHMQVSYHGLIGVFYHLTKNPVLEYYHKQKAAEIVWHDKEYLENKPDETVTLLQNIIHLSRSHKFFGETNHWLKRYNEFIKVHEKNLGPIGKTLNRFIRIFQRFMFYCDAGEFDKAYDMLPEMLDWTKNDKSINTYQRSRNVTEILHLLFMMKRYKEAIRLIHEFSNSKLLNNKSKTSAWFMLMLIHFEEKNFDVAVQQIIPLMKRLHKDGMENEFISLLVRSIREAIRKPDLLNSNIFFKKTSVHFEEYRMKNKTAKLIDGINFSYWLKAHATQTDYIDAFIKDRKPKKEFLDALRAIGVEIVSYQSLQNTSGQVQL